MSEPKWLGHPYKTPRNGSIYYCDVCGEAKRMHAAEPCHYPVGNGECGKPEPCALHPRPAEPAGPTPAPLKDVREGFWWRLANGTYYGQGFGPHPLVFENWFEVGKLEKLVRVRVTVEEL